MNKVGLLFAGQGQQYCGMADQLLNKSDIYKRAKEVLGYDLVAICNDEEKLNQTIYTQPAMLTFSHGLYELLSKHNIAIDYVAGLSLGEYNALLAADVLSFENALAIVNQRAQIMSAALPAYTTKMAAVLKTDVEIINDALNKKELNNEVAICNYNTFDQIVIGGTSEKVDLAINLLKDAGCKRVVELDVSIVSHMHLLDEASSNLKKVLESYSFNEPVINFINNIEAKVQKDGFVETLSKQISQSTHMAQTIELMLENGVRTFIEIAPKSALSSFVKSIAKAMDIKVEIKLINDVTSLNEVINEVKDYVK